MSRFLLLVLMPSLWATEFQVQVFDAAGQGFNSTTPATPVGGNSGTTLGQQRLIALQYAAQLWAKELKARCRSSFIPASRL
ncbi:MAG: hypothetical protein KDC71_17160 [Acidobacteria bacterium]|nr:hypothetical protein [Acidobacteriota bacterium]